MKKVKNVEFGIDYTVGCMWCDIHYTDGSKTEKNYCTDTEKNKYNGNIIKAIASIIEAALYEDINMNNK